MPRIHSDGPNWRPPQRGLFIDRWGTLLELPGSGWVRRFEDARFTRGAVDALFHACQAGLNIYLLGNVDPVAFGEQDQSEWDTFQRDLHDALRRGGVKITRDYSCTENPAGKAPHDTDSVYLLPNTGAMYHAAQTDGVSLRHSVVVGDSSLELVAGWRAGCRTAGVRTGLAVKDRKFEVDPDITGENLAGVVREVLTRVSVSAV
jgi:histidinol phosphatase-like enzyme